MTGLARIGAVTALVLAAAWAVHTRGGEIATTDTTGPRTGQSLAEQMAQPVHAVWSKAPLREALSGLARSQQVAIWLDCRVDPGSPLELAADGKPLADVLARIAQSHALGLSRFGPLVYLGPPEAARRLQTLAELRREEAQRLKNPAAALFQRTSPTRWDSLTTPRELLQSLGQKNNLEIRGLDRVPHDLWAAADWPAMPLGDRLTLLLAPFDLTFRIDPTGRTIELVPLPEDVSLTRDYPGGGNANALADKWAAELPGCRVWVEGDRMLVRGLLEDHERLDASTAQRRAPAGPADLGQTRIQRFTVKERPLREVLDHLARQLGLKIELDEAALGQSGIRLDRRVSVQVENASVDELFRALLAPCGLDFTRRGTSIEIRPAMQQ